MRRIPDLDIIRIQDAGLSGANDAAVLDWAAREDRILLTHDVSTLTAIAYARIREGRAMPGVFEVDLGAPVGAIIDDIVLLAECTLDNEWEGQIRYLPLR